MEGIILFFFFYGSYAKDLDDLGIGYCNINLLKNLFFGFFQLKHKLKNNKVFKKQWIENKHYLSRSNQAVLGTCLLPDYLFKTIIKYIFIKHLSYY